MGNDTERPFYRLLKWIWLLSQCAMPLLAALYVARFLSSPYFEQMPVGEWFHILLVISGSVYLLFWLIAEALLCMYRFPLKAVPAALLVGGFVVQFIVLAVTGESVGFAAFTGIYVTLAALYGCLVILIIACSKEMIWRHLKRGIAAIIIMVLGSLPLIALFMPVWAVYGALSPLYQVVNGLLLLTNVWFILRNLVDFSIWGKPDPQRAEHDAEWKKWAAPTIILLILAATAAALVAGIYGSLQD